MYLSKIESSLNVTGDDQVIMMPSAPEEESPMDSSLKAISVVQAT